MRHYPEIFPHLERALFDSFIVSLYSLYETRRGRISVPELVRSLKSSLVAIKHKGLEGKVSELKVIWKKIGILRNQIVAHQASNCKPEDSFAAADIPGEDFQEFFRKSKCLLKSISSEVIGKNLTFNNKSKRSLEALLRDLRQHCSLKLVHPEPVEG